jgi:hypothetical protein
MPLGFVAGGLACGLEPPHPQTIIAQCIHGTFDSLALREALKHATEAHSLSFVERHRFTTDRICTGVGAMQQ